MAKSRNITYLILIGIVIIVAAFYLLSRDKAPEEIEDIVATEYSTDTTLTGDQTMPAGEKTLLKNGAILTVNGNLTLDGSLECENGPLNLVVNGKLTVSGTLNCDRGESIPNGGMGNGIGLVVTDEIEFTDDSVLVTNGHVQLVDDASNLATTKEKIDELFDDAADDSGAETEGYRMGPLIPLESLDDITFLPNVLETSEKQILLPQDVELSFLGKVQNSLIPETHALEVPATDSTGTPVPDAVRIGGRWFVGNPGVAPPKNLNIPTPPKNIKKIILNFNFGPGKTMTLSNWTLTGPDGHIGDSDTGSCDVTGKKGHDAMRLNARASNITINNFTLNLGNGGEGGTAETSKDCDPGTAKGGDGGSAGNLKMIASQNFQITGAFNLNPGKGGPGGKATAHGKKGEDGCPAKKGGDADARGGKGGDNKKGLKIVGTVAGTSNINIGKIVGGKGGLAVANGGDGGNGTGCNCDGGLGGSTKATGGKGGDAISKKFESIGGDGGDTSNFPGAGGKGGTCDASGPGGDGGNGGNVQTSERSQPGTGSTSNGKPGTSLNKVGGSGGNGGDGCNEGAGGKGGNGDPNGPDGLPGKNLCVGEEPETAALAITLDPQFVTFDCTPEGTDTIVQRINIGVPPDHSWDINPNTLPPGLNADPSQGTFETEIVSLSLTCTEPIVVNIAGQQTEWNVQINLNDSQGEFVVDSFFDVFVELDLSGESTLGPISINQNAFDFVYDHSNPSCPLNIGTLVLDAPADTFWIITYDESGTPWLSFPGGTSGQGPAEIPMQFPCLLNEYKNQTQSTNFNIDVKDGNDKILESKSVEVNGEFKNF